MEFKVGDRVRLKSKSKDVIIENTVFMKYVAMKHDTFTIKGFAPGGFVRIEEDKEFWLWSLDWFEGAEIKPITIFNEIKLSFLGNKTVARINGCKGVAYRNKCDKEDRKVGILIATMRALGFSKSTVDKVIDVLFDDLKEIDKCTTEELLKEIVNRVK